MNRKTLIYLLLILAVAAALRLAALNRIPYGVFIDEGVNGVEGIQAIRSGHFHLYYPANFTEGPFVTLIGFSETIFGVNQFALRLVPALAGVLTVLVTFFFARRLYSDGVAVFAAWFMATGFWHLLFSRLAINAAIFVPLFLVMSVYFLRLGMDQLSAEPGSSSRMRWWGWVLLAGTSYGLGFYTYLPFRATPLLLMLIFLLDLQRRRKHEQALGPWLRTFAFFVLVALIVTVPLANYFLHHPEQLTLRMTQKLSVTDDPHPVRAEIKILRRTLGMFNLHGDENWRHNISGRPELTAPVGIFALAGFFMTFAHALRKRWQAPNEWMLLGWFAIMLLPETLTYEGIPHSMRAIGVVVPVYLFAGIGADSAFGAARNKIWLKALLVILIVATAVYDARLYFRNWGKHPAHVFMQTFSQRQADESGFLNSLPASTPRFVISDEGPISPLHSDPAVAAEVDYHMAMRAQTVAFGTMDNVHPVFMDIEEAMKQSPARFPAGSVIVALEGRASTLEALQKQGVNLQILQKPSFAYAVVR
ncbi:MAG: ArnT family glycosyltransferase [Terriglobales bacterium]